MRPARSHQNEIRNPHLSGVPKKMGMESLLQILKHKLLRINYLSDGITMGLTLPQSGPL